MTNPALQGLKVGDRIDTQTYRATDGTLHWFVVPPGMTREEAYETQEHYGPFATDAEVSESQRVTIFGAQGKVTKGGAWDPAWDKPQ